MLLKLLLLAPALLCAQTRNLDIYWIDVEGGAATLIVAPSGESLLADTGNPGTDDRDAKRIFEVATKQADLKRIDYLVTTHFHSDHVGGAPALAKLIPIERFLDHGDSSEIQSAGDRQRWEAYKTIAEGKRTILKPGDVVPLKGVDIKVVMANGEAMAAPAGGTANPLCNGAHRKEPDPGENGRSVGFLLTFGKFKFLDLGDLTWNKEMDLACPQNKIGTVTLLQATHHGFFNDLSGAPALVWAIRPQVVVVNNGPRKGLAGPAYERITGIPGIEAVWQAHLSLATDKDHNTAEQKIANLEPTAGCKGNWLKASIGRDGRFTITNSRNGYSEAYASR